MKRNGIMTMIILLFAIALCLVGCGNNLTEASEVNSEQMIEYGSIYDEEYLNAPFANEGVVNVLWEKCYVSTSIGDHGFFEISLFSDYSCRYCTSMNESDIKCGTWTVDEYSILAIMDSVLDNAYCKVNYFEILPCISEGIYRLEYMPEVSDGFGIEAGNVEVLYPEYDYDYVALDNVLGEEADFVFYDGTMPLIGNYLLSDSMVCIEVWGTNPKDVVITDLDGDKKNELVATVMWGDGTEDVLIYTAAADGFMKAYGSSLLKYEYLEGYAWSVMVEYIPEKNMVGISYIPKNESEYCYVEYELNLDLLDWQML